MTLQLWHRRPDPEAEYNGEGQGDVLILEGVSEVRYIYGEVFVWFEDDDYTEEALRLTGWDRGIIGSLQMIRYEDLIRTEHDEEGTSLVWFYSDWNVLP